MVAAVAGFCLYCVWAAGAARLCGCVGKFRTIVAVVAGLFCLCCVWAGCSATVGRGVNSAKSLRSLPVCFVCVLFGPSYWPCVPCHAQCLRNSQDNPVLCMDLKTKMGWAHR